jgi:dipeptidyl-peptidase 4
MNFKVLLFLIVAVSIQAQKNITVEDIWLKGTTRAKSVPGFNYLNDGKSYAVLSKNNLIKYDLATGNPTDTIAALDPKIVIVDSYEFNKDESKLLISSSTESIYRRSSKSIIYTYDIVTKKLELVVDKNTKISNATFSPDSKKIAWNFENNLYYKNLTDNTIAPITNDGKSNAIINGMCDWVYEEEFAFTRAFEWSPNSQKIAYLRFDESKVPEFTMQKFDNGPYPQNITFKYPKVGENNAIVTTHIFDIVTKKNMDIQLDKKSIENSDAPEEFDAENRKMHYTPRLVWTKNPNELAIVRLNRHQNRYQIQYFDLKKQSSGLMYQEENKYFVALDNNLSFRDEKTMICTSERDGFTHIYKNNLITNTNTQLTKGKWDVTAFYGIDQSKGDIYYQAATKNPMNKEIWKVNINTGIVTLINDAPGVNDASFSSNFQYFLHTNSTINTAPTYNIVDVQSRKIVRSLENNSNIATLQKDFRTNNIEFFTFKTSEGVDLNGWMMKPSNMSKNKKYPVFMTQYSGPGSQQVLNKWKGNDYWWYEMLTQKEYIVVCVDGRGTGARGEEFRKMTYLQLGKYETIDQIEAAKYLGTLPFVDAKRIGIFGWSYGGYMSSLCILKGADVFKSAIAVAPVANWKWYDTVYTERYMRTAKENEKGYEDNSPINFADQLKGNYLIVHGMGDDNVHFQNSVEMVNALIKAGKQFDSAYYPNRDHGINSGNSRHHLYTKMTNFILEKL